jgi:hypothetical protein
MHLTLLPQPLAIARLSPDSDLPGWLGGEFFSVTHTPDELSIVCEETRIPAGVTVEKGWRALRVAGPLDFALVGILAQLSSALAAAGVSIFAISTYDTDYILIKEPSLPSALSALRHAGHTIMLPAS